MAFVRVTALNPLEASVLASSIDSERSGLPLKKPSPPPAVPVSDIRPHLTERQQLALLLKQSAEESNPQLEKSTETKDVQVVDILDDDDDSDSCDDTSPSWNKRKTPRASPKKPASKNIITPKLSTVTPSASASSGSPDGFSTWSEAKKKAFECIKENPNAYYYRHTAPGEVQRNGKWSKGEVETFFAAIEKHPPKNKWGVFAMHIPGRVGYQCRNFYHSLLKEGVIVDEDYVDEKNNYTVKKVHSASSSPSSLGFYVVSEKLTAFLKTCPPDGASSGIRTPSISIPSTTITTPTPTSRSKRKVPDDESSSELSPNSSNRRYPARGSNSKSKTSPVPSSSKSRKFESDSGSDDEDEDEDSESGEDDMEIDVAPSTSSSSPKQKQKQMQSIPPLPILRRSHSPPPSSSSSLSTTSTSTSNTTQLCMVDDTVEALRKFRERHEKEAKSAFPKQSEFRIPHTPTFSPLTTPVMSPRMTSSSPPPSFALTSQQPSPYVLKRMRALPQPVRFIAPKLLNPSIIPPSTRSNVHSETHHGYMRLAKMSLTRLERAQAQEFAKVGNLLERANLGIDCLRRARDPKNAQMPIEIPQIGVTAQEKNQLLRDVLERQRMEQETNAQLKRFFMVGGSMI